MSLTDPQHLIKNLLVSPDIYDCRDIYEKIYEDYGGELDALSLTIITDQVDVIYKRLMDKVNKLIRLRYAHEPFIFHRWIDPRTAIFGSAQAICVK